MTDEALRRDNAGGTGNLSNVPLHMADLGTENYDQEFTLGLIENEQGTLELVNEALDRMENGTFGQCVECDEPISKPRLQAIPYARHCIRLCTEAGGWRMRQRRGVGLGRLLLFWSIALGGTVVRPGDQVDRLRQIGPPRLLDRSRSCPTSWSSTPARTPARSGDSERACPAAA